MSGSTDMDASWRRLDEARQALAAQQRFIAEQTDLESKAIAEADLVVLQTALEIAKAAHVFSWKNASKSE